MINLAKNRVAWMALGLVMSACAGADEPLPGDGEPAAPLGEVALGATPTLRQLALDRMRKTTGYFHDVVARRNGYAWHQKATDLNERWGDVKLDANQYMIQSPGTSDVTIAYVEAALADTSWPQYRTYATDAAMAVRMGQIKSGGWRLYADLNTTIQPQFQACYRYLPENCACAGCTSTTYDDQVTQNALIALMRTDALLGLVDNTPINDASKDARAAMVTSQYPNLGGFPQVFSGPVASRPAVLATYPTSIGTSCGLATCYGTTYSTKYYDDPTLNDNLATAFVEMLAWARDIYKIKAPALSATYQGMLTAYGNFLRLAQMPQPQPAWAQQYDSSMQPRWARKWEAPAIAGQESQDVMWALLRLYQLDPTQTDNRTAVGTALTYLEPLDYVSNGQNLIHRYIELNPSSPLNRGFFMPQSGYPATLTRTSTTYDNYAWEVPSELTALRAEYNRLATDTTPRKRSCTQLRTDTENAINTVVDLKKWVTTYSPVGPRGSGSTAGDYLDTRKFVTNVRTLAEFITRTTTDCVAQNY